VISLTAGVPRGRSLTILCLGAHADDIEIGCGGTILRLLAERPRTSVHWVVASAHGARTREAQRSAARLLRGAASRDVRVEAFRDGFLPYDGARVKEMFEELKTRVSPDMIFTHRIDDAHQDHRLISELTRNTFRDHLILEYEIPKYDGDLGHPNVFVPLPTAIRRRKVRLLLSAFPSQASRRWFTAATFEGLMRVRGIECAAPDGFAEAFHVGKMILEAGGRG
jgi:LmbE family N-acetylglucosaminyl deacetylase